jgi:hypothetical protein
MGSSREEAIAQLRKWAAAKAPIKASFVGKGLRFKTTGRVFLDEEQSEVLLLKGSEENPRVVVSFSLLIAVPSESFEPLRDAPNDFKFKMDFFAAEAFELPYGCLDFREMAGVEDDL